MLSLPRFGHAGAQALLVVAAAAVLAPAPLVGAAPQAPAATRTAMAPDVTTLGPQVGDKVPAFTLPDQHDQVRSLTSLMGPKGLVLVFNRSADW